MKSILAAAIVFGVAFQARADEPKKYSLKLVSPIAKVGAPSKASLKIEVAEGSHVSEDAPLKLLLKSDDGLKLDKEKLTQADVNEGRGISPKLDIGYVASKAGAHKIEGEATFIVCTKELCEREQEHVSIDVTAK